MEKQKGVIFCSYEGKWKEEMEKRLQTSEKVTLLVISRIRYKLLAYLRDRQDIEIVKLNKIHEEQRQRDRNKSHS